MIKEDFKLKNSSKKKKLKYFQGLTFSLFLAEKKNIWDESINYYDAITVYTYNKFYYTL